MKHIADKVCSCKYCTMIDCMVGDPLLTEWEKNFIKSVCDFGWIGDYTEKQKKVIEKIFNKQKIKYCSMKEK